MKSSHLRLVVFALLAVLSMSIVPILIRSTAANEVTIGLARIGVAMAVLSPFIWLRLRPRLSAKDWLGLVMVGTVFGAHWLTYFLSIKMASAAIAAIAISTYGIHLLLLNWLVKGYPVRPIDWLAVLVCFGGCLLIAPSFDLADNATLGLLVGVVSGFLYGMMPLLHQRIMHIPTATRAWGQFLFAGIIFLPLAGFSDWHLQAGDWWRLLILGVVCTVIGHGLWVKASSELPPVITGVTYYCYVPIAMVLSFVFLKEHISISMVLGAGCIIAANVTTALLAWSRATGGRREKYRVASRQSPEKNNCS